MLYVIAASLGSVALAVVAAVVAAIWMRKKTLRQIHNALEDIEESEDGGEDGVRARARSQKPRAWCPTRARKC